MMDCWRSLRCKMKRLEWSNCFRRFSFPSLPLCKWEEIFIFKVCKRCTSSYVVEFFENSVSFKRRAVRLKLQSKSTDFCSVRVLVVRLLMG